MTQLILLLALAAAAPGKPGPPPPTPPPEPPPLVTAPGTGGWSVVGALTAPINVNLVEAAVGWPGLHAAFRRGISKELEMGAQFSVNYGVEGMVGAVVPGLKFQFLLRYKFFDNGKLSLAARFEPGPLFYFYTSANINTCAIDQFGNLVCGRSTSAVGGFALPLGMRLGIAASSAINIGVSFDLPLWFSFGRTAIFYAPILMGLGAEYFLQSNLALTFAVKMGPTLSSSGPTTFNPNGAAIFTFESKLGVGYRF